MNVLIIKLGALGDVVMATALIRAIVDHHPHDTVHLLTTPAFAPLFEAWPRLHVTARPRRGAATMWSTWRWVRSLRCATIYDLQGNDRSAVLCALSGARMRIGNHPRYPYTHHPPSPWQGQKHIFERMREVLASAGITDVGAVPYLPVTSAARAAVERWRTERGLTDRGFALCHAGASAARPEKCWTHFVTLAQRLRAHGVEVVWIGAESDRGANQRCVAAAGGIDSSGVFTINELAVLGSYARFAITNDSGPMHALAASGIPVFGLFGPSDWRRNHALEQRQWVIATATPGPIANISVDTVWSRLCDAGVLSAPAQPLV